MSYTEDVLFNPPGEETTDVYSLTMNNVQPSDEGWYCCVATNEGGSTIDCAWLEVNSKLYYSLKHTNINYIPYCLGLRPVSYKRLVSFSGRGKQHYNKNKRRVFCGSITGLKVGHTC